MSSEKDNILEFNQYMKSDKMSYIIYADTESLIKKQMEVQIIQKILQQQKLESIFLVDIFNVNYMAFDNIYKKHTLYRGQDCIKKICESLREHAKKIIDFEKKKMLPLTKEELKSYQDTKVCYICGKKLLKQLANDRNYQKVRDHCHFRDKYRGVAHSICNLRFNLPNKIPAVFYNGSNNDYHFIIKELVNGFEGQFESIGKNTEEYKTFSVPIETEVINIDKDVNESVVTISYKRKFIIVKDLWQVHYQILLIIFRKEILKLNVKIAIVFLNIKVSRTI